MSKQPIFLFLITVALINANFAEEAPVQPQTDFDQAVNLAGITYNNAGNMLDIIIDVNQALAAIPAMQHSGIVNPNLNDKDIKLLPLSLAVSLVGIFYTGGIIQHLYSENKTLTNLHVNTYVLAANDFGIITKQSCYSFDFTRELYAKINWDNFVAPNLISITPNFTFSTWCKAIMSEETGEPVE